MTTTQRQVPTVESSGSWTVRVRLGLRRVWRRPLFSLIGVAVLGGGIGSAIAVFRVLDRMLLAPPSGVSDPRGLWDLEIAPDAGGAPRDNFSYSEVQNVATLGPRVKSAAYVRADTVMVVLAGAHGSLDSVLTKAEFVSNGYFATVGVGMATGRGIGEDSGRLDTPGSGVVLGFDLWNRMGGTRGLPLGTAVRIRGRVFTLIGVARRGFVGVDHDPAEAWLPLGVAALSGANSEPYDLRSGFPFQLLVRLPRGVSRSTGRTMLAPALFGVPEPGAGLRRSDAERIQLQSVGTPHWATDGVHLPLVVMLAVVCAGILLIACGNVATMLLARAMRFAGDTRIQLALGASRRNVLAQQIVESGQVVIAGSVVGLGLSEFLYGYAYRLLAPQSVHVAAPIDARTASFAIGVVTCVAVCSLAVPLVHTWRLTSNQWGGTQSPPASRHAINWQRSLIAIQVALCFALLVGAGLFMKSFRETLSARMGLRIPGLLYVDLASTERIANRIPSASLEQATALSAALRGLPGVQDVAIGSTLPLDHFAMIVVNIPELVRSGHRRVTGLYVTAVSPRYFAALGSTLLEGRGFTDADREGAPLVTVVDRTMADEIWPAVNPLGRCLQIGPPPFQCFSVVGVIADPPGLGLRTAPVMQYFLPAAQRPDLLGNGGYLFVRVTGSEDAAIARLRARLLASAPPGVHPVVGSLRGLAEPEIRPLHAASTVLAIVGLIGLLLAGTGVYAVTLYHVRARSREFGIRMAIGSSRRAIIWLVLRQVLATALVGAAIGATLVAGFARYMAPLLFHVSPYDPVVYGLGLLVLVAAAVASVSTPARLITRINLREILAGDAG